MHARDRVIPDGNWAVLRPALDAGQEIPISYVRGLAGQDPRSFGFGLTRLFKAPHKDTVGDKHAKLTRHRIVLGKDAYDPDFVESLFGYSHEPRDIGVTEGATAPQDVARKGRIACSFARLDETGVAAVTHKQRTIMGAPKASFGPFYLLGPYKDWSHEASRLAGRKRYVPRFAATSFQEAWDRIARGLRQQLVNYQKMSRRPAPDSITTELRFLVPQDGRTPLRFRSKIRLHNVTAAEIGAGTANTGGQASLGPGWFDLALA